MERSNNSNIYDPSTDTLSICDSENFTNQNIIPGLKPMYIQEIDRFESLVHFRICLLKCYYF